MHSFRLVALLLPLIALVALLTLSGAPVSAASSSSSKAAAPLPPLPTLAQILDQDFEVSVVTSLYGSFNASLRMRASPHFPERIHAELIPKGDAAEGAGEHKGKAALPHLQRPRSVLDESFTEAKAPLIVSPTDDAAKKKKKVKKDGLAPVTVEHPTLLVLELTLRHASSEAGTARVFALPAAEAAMQSMREAMEEERAAPSVTASFHFYAEPESFIGDAVLHDIPGVARSASAALMAPAAPSAAAAAAAKDIDSTTKGPGAGEASAQVEGEGGVEVGTVTVRLVSEHEFTLRASLALPGGGSGSGARLHILAHAYAPATTKLLDREVQKPKTFAQRYGFLIIMGLTFLLQTTFGLQDARKKTLQEERQKAALKDNKRDATTATTSSGEGESPALEKKNN